MPNFFNKYPYTDFHELNLDWILETVKNIAAEWAETLTEWHNTQEEWQQLYDYVHDYFDNLDVQHEINNKINEMIADGTFVTITTPVIEAKTALMVPDIVSDQLGGVVAQQIGGAVAQQIDAAVAAQIGSTVATETAQWLTDHVDPVGSAVTIDNTLTIAGSAADSKVVGDTFTAVEAEIDNIVDSVATTMAPSYNDDFTISANPSYEQLVLGEDFSDGKYYFIIETDAAFSCSSIRLTYGTTTVYTIPGGTITPSTPYIYALTISNATINRVRLYNTDTGANIKIKLASYSTNAGIILNGLMIGDYMCDFTINKAASASWLDGYSVQVQNTNFIRTDAGYSIKHLTVKAGDIIYIHYPNISHLLPDSRYTLSERIIYGTGVTESAFRGIFKGGEQDYIYISEKDMDMTVCAILGYKCDVYQYSVESNKYSADYAARRYMNFPYDETTTKLAISKGSYNQYNETRPKPLTLLHFSDIHNSIVNAEQIREFMEMYGIYLNDVICTGDMTGRDFANYYPVYAQTGFDKILLTIGNHDVYDASGGHGGSDDPDYWATNLQKYNQYFAPSITEWGSIVQPAGAAANGLCYYYKDYTSNGYGYRLIVLDAMAYDSAQHSWFVSTLNDARYNSLTVVVAEHFPPINGIGDVSGYNTPFMSLLTGMEYSYANANLTAPNGNARDAVDAFMSSGGEFACWLCGHMHYDQVARITSHPNQIFIAVGSASVNAVWADQPRYIGTPSENLFNVISIDPYLKMIKIERFGAVVDDWGRMHEHVSINYQTKQLISTST